MRQVLVILIVGLISISFPACEVTETQSASNQASVSYSKPTPKTQSITTNKTSTQSANSSSVVPASSSISTNTIEDDKYDDYKKDIRAILTDLEKELKKYEIASNKKDSDTWEHGRKSDDLERSERAFKSLYHDFFQLDPPVKVLTDFHHLMNRCLRDLKDGVGSQAKYHHKMSLEDSFGAERYAREAGEDLKSFYETYPRVIRMYNDLP